MKHISYNKYGPDSWVKPLSLQIFFSVVLSILFVVLIFFIGLYLNHYSVTNDLTAAIFPFVFVAVALPLFYIIFYSIITDYIRQTRVYDNGMLQLPRAKLAISDIVKISVEEQETILSPIKVCYVFTRDEKCYRVSIAEPLDFVRDLKQYNKDIIIEQTQQ